MQDVEGVAPGWLVGRSVGTFLFFRAMRCTWSLFPQRPSDCLYLILMITILQFSSALSSTHRPHSRLHLSLHRHITLISPFRSPLTHHSLSTTIKGDSDPITKDEMLTPTLFLSFALLASSINAATTTIQVGATGIAFTPDSATAAVGDVFEFHFYPANHSVVQGVYSNPCAPSSDTAFYSGFVPSEEGEAVG